MQLPLLTDKNVKGKRVFLLADLDAPLTSSEPLQVDDDMRLVGSMPTINYLLEHGASIILAGKLGRPGGMVKKELSLEPVAKWLDLRFKISPVGDKHDLRVGKRGEFDGWEIGQNIFLLENLRFNPGEEANDPTFAKQLAALVDIYVNEAFSLSHRNHASVVGVPKFLPHFAGFHLEKEITNLTRAMENPKRPLVVIVGGKKIETKLPLVEKMHRIADYVLVGGKIAQESKAFLKIRHERIREKKSVLLVADSAEDGLSITEKSLYNFLDIIPLAGTVIWNGTMGFIGEKEDRFSATRKIASAIIKSKAYSIVGGGDTVEYLNKLGILDKFSFASTGGGAMLAFLSGEKLPGLVVLEKT